MAHDAELAGDMCVQVRMLAERSSSLRRLTLRACDLTEHDPDVPLIFDLRPLAEVPPIPCSLNTPLLYLLYGQPHDMRLQSMIMTNVQICGYVPAGLLLATTSIHLPLTPCRVKT